jgi:ribonucleotide reductase beta subunit family protein with ferritin-like domain
MTQTFESLILDIRHAIEQSLTPSELTTALYDAVKRAEDYEEEWINDMYENSEDGFTNYIY